MNKRVLLPAILGLLCATLAAPVSAAQELVFTSPPRESAEDGLKVYKPIADYLSRVIGKPVVYKHPGNFLTYQYDMRQGKYDIVFDGPHFVSWRMHMIDHEPLVTLPGNLAFTVMVNKDNQDIQTVQDLRGHTVCGLAPPNLATLTLYSLFDNPARQPLVIRVNSFPEAYQQVAKGKCVAAVMRDKMFNKLNKKHKAGRAIFNSKGIANQTFSAGPRVSPQQKEKIIEAMLSEQGVKTMQAFHKRFNKNSKPMKRAKREDYTDLALLLKDAFGFSIAKQ